MLTTDPMPRVAVIRQTGKQLAMSVPLINEIESCIPRPGRAKPKSIADHLRSLVDSAQDATLLFDADQVVFYANPAAILLAYSLREDESVELRLLTDWHPKLLPENALRMAADSGGWSGELLVARAGTRQKVLFAQLRALGRDFSAPYGLIVRDVSDESERRDESRVRNVELEAAYQQLEGAQGQIVQSEKLASIGQLAAGVAHEINNPIGYVNSNISTLEKYVTRYLSVVQTAFDTIARTADPTAIAEMEDIKQRFDLDFMANDVRQLIAESKSGIDRVCKIVRDLKDFSRRDHEANWTITDIHKCIESTLNIAWSELKYKAQIIKTFGVLPPIECVTSEINQVLLNLLLNAGQAMNKRGVITISTGCSDSSIWIAIGDDGDGMAPDVLPHIFEPFFTTKSAGEGTGLGLAISYGIVKKHHGDIQVTSTLGQGTLFRIELPINQP